MPDFTIPSTLFTGGDATSYDLPNYFGELYSLMPQEVPFLSMIGGLNGGREVSSRDFTWEVQDGEAASATAQKLENQDPTGNLVTRQAVSNVVEIHQEAVEFGYTAQAVTGQLGPLAPNATTGVALDGSQSIMDPMANQINLKIGKVKRDLEMSFLNGTINVPTTNAAARRTQGIIAATTSHAVNYTTGSYTTIRDALNDLLLDMAAPSDEANTAPFRQPFIMVIPAQKITLSNEYSNSGALAPRDRSVGGVNIDTLVTDFGTFGVAMNRYVPAGTLLVVDVSVCRPVHLSIPGKGSFFVEPLAKTGATDKAQLYGEIGLEYGPETFHGKITAIT